MIPVMFASSVDNISWELIIMHRWPIKCLQIPVYYFMDGHMRMTISRFLYPAQFVGTASLFSSVYLPRTGRRTNLRNFLACSTLCENHY